KFDLRKVYGVKRYEQARKTLEGNTDISSEHKSGIITIKVTDKNRDRAAAMARQYVTALNDVVITLNTGSAHKERVFLEDRLTQVQKSLEVAEKEFSQFASQNTALDVKEQGRAMIGAAADLEGQLIAAETQLQGLQQIYTPENVRIRSLQARIDEYRRQLNKMGGKPGLSTDAGNTPGDEGTTDSSGLYPSIRQLPILGVAWADLYRNAKVQEAVYETLTKQYELAKVEEARETPSVKVLDPADVPESKSFPPRMILIAFAVMLVFFGTCVWILAGARWHEIDPADPGKMLVQEIFQSVRARLNSTIKAIERRGKQHSA
ncbi:MAG: GNVR domain-containing protein, partial [Candidatus Sulfotelmatobacter sp.]